MREFVVENHSFPNQIYRIVVFLYKMLHVKAFKATAELLA
jgi:hypothetical protein